MKKIKSIFDKFRKNETGAAAAETAITIVWFLLIILGIIQLTLIFNAKFLVNYAAYTAARAGIVHNGFATADGRTSMRSAAALALAPIYSKSGNLGHVAIGYGLTLAQTYNPVIALGAIRVEILDPISNKAIKLNDGTPGSSSRFSPNYTGRFFPEFKRYEAAPRNPNETRQLNENILVVRVTYGFPLRVPVVNRILSPFAPIPYAEISSTHRMRMQSDAKWH